ERLRIDAVDRLVAAVGVTDVLIAFDQIGFALEDKRTVDRYLKVYRQIAPVVLDRPGVAFVRIFLLCDLIADVLVAFEEIQPAVGRNKAAVKRRIGRVIHKAVVYLAPGVADRDRGGI